MAFELPKLNYAFNALEPHIDARTMEIHHGKHHQAYVTNLNNAIKGTDAENLSIENICKNISKYPAAVRNNGGGHYNHALFWQMLKKSEGGAPAGELAKAIDKSFGSFAKWQEQFGEAAGKVFGSGWAWLVWRDKKLVIESSPNQDSPLSSGGIPILGVDVWEHAYYLKYQNRRAEYVKAFQSVINWDFVSARFADAAK